MYGDEQFRLETDTGSAHSPPNYRALLADVYRDLYLPKVIPRLFLTSKRPAPIFELVSTMKVVIQRVKKASITRTPASP